MPITSERRVSVSKVRAPWSPALYLWKVEAAGHPSRARCSCTVSCQAAAMLKNVRRAGADSRRRTSGSGLTSIGSGADVARAAARRFAPCISIYGHYSTFVDSKDVGGAATGPTREAAAIGPMRRRRRREVTKKRSCILLAFEQAD